jgi:hypothetical protein
VGVAVAVESAVVAFSGPVLIVPPGLSITFAQPGVTCTERDRARLIPASQPVPMQTKPERR